MPYEFPFCTAEDYALQLDPDLYDKDKQVVREFIAHNDPARYGVRIDLVPVDRAFDLMYARALNQSLLQSLAAQFPLAPLSPSGGGGAMMSMSSGSGEATLSDISLLTNGIQVEMTTTFSTVTSWDMFRSEDLPTPTWSLLETDIAITNDTTATRVVSFDDDFSTFALGRAADTTGNGVRDSFGFFLYGLNQEDLTEGLVGHWSFDETAGATISDCVNTNHGELGGTTASAGQIGPVGRAMCFAGTNDPDADLDYLLIPDAPTLDVQTNITLTAWIYPESSNSLRRSVFQKNSAYFLNILNGKIQFYFQGLANPGYHQSTIAVATKDWSHIAVTYEGSTITFYINGEEINQVAMTGVGNASSGSLGIGYGSGSPERYFEGKIDDARIYSEALSSNQVYSLYEVGEDLDGDGLSFANESQALTDHDNEDTDGDGLKDGEELAIYLTDPTESNEFADISGTVTYKGSSTGQVVVIASPSRFGWDTNNSTTLSTTGTYTIANIPVRSNYWIRAFRDLNSNGVYEANEPPHFSFTNVSFSASGVANINVHIEKLKGMRVEFGTYYGGQWTGFSTDQVAQQIVDDAEEWGVNTLYPTTINPVFGTWWNSPTNQYLEDENGHGAANILGKLVTKAHAKGIKVIAWIQPINANTNAWNANPSWRFKKKNGTDWDGDFAMLTPFNTNVLNWLDGVVNEVLDQGVDGIDIAETFYDKFSDNPDEVATFDAAVSNLYFEIYPNGTLGDDNWFRLRDQILTSNIYERLGRIIVSAGKEFHVTQTWDAKSNGSLQPDDVLARNTGLRFGEIMDIPEDARPDYVIPELIWQREASENLDTDFDPFNPEWTIEVVQEYVSFVRGRVLPSIHPEITLKTFGTNIIPSLSQFENTMAYSLTNAAGCDFFIHNLAFTNNYLPNGTNANSFGYTAVSNVFWFTP